VKALSLRARLVLGLLAIAAVGLVVLGGVTYASQRNFLQDRIDEQARDGLPSIGHRIDEELGIAATRFDRFRPDRRGGVGDGPPPTNLPPGTYGQRISASGEAVPDSQVGVSYGVGTLEAIELPTDLKVNEVRSVEVSGTRYRLRAERNRTTSDLNVIAIPLNEMDDTLSQLLLVEGLVIVAVLGVLGGVALLLVRVGLRPLDRMAQTADAIAEGDLSRRVEPADHNTEVGRLGLALNTMLGRLETAFAGQRQSEDRLRRFVADASHELRTPLASIRGYAELFRMGAGEDPVESAKAMRRIEDEAKRMGVLVEDLLALARLDETRAFVREPVDIADLAADAVEDARATAPDREIALKVAPGEDPIVLADPDQLRQVLANLLRNALVHTPPGSPIDVQAASAAGNGHVRLVVRDHGAGLPDGDPDAVFERFWRAGGGGRTQGPAGAGLGLAIVAGIVDAHGGTVHAENAPDGGARFVIELPAFTGDAPSKR